MSWSGWTTRDQAGTDYWEKIASADMPPEYRTSIICAVVAGMHAAEHFDKVEAEESVHAAVEVVEYIGALGHLFGSRDMRFLIDPASLPIGTKLYLRRDLSSTDLLPLSPTVENHSKHVNKPSESGIAGGS